MSPYRWLTDIDDLARDMAKVTTITDARELRDEVLAWFMNRPSRRTTGIADIATLQITTIDRLRDGMGQLSEQQQDLWAKALDDREWHR